jgi:hypothetical protein
MNTSFIPILLFGGAIGCGFLSLPAAADEPTLPPGGFDANHYETLWTKSPFAVATAVEAAPESQDYDLAGVAQVDGISYASLIDKHDGSHFVVTGDQPSHGFTLVSITQSHGGSGAVAVVQKDGESLTLKLADAPPLNGAPVPMVSPPPMFNLPMPGANMAPPGNPPVHYHHHIIVIPPR